MGVKTVTVIGLLLFPSAVSAACAWVLWVESWKVGGGRYHAPSPEAAYETKAECESRLKETIARVAASHESFRPPGSVKIAGAVVFIKTEDGEIAYERKCLPDTLTLK